MWLHSSFPLELKRLPQVKSQMPPFKEQETHIVYTEAEDTTTMFKPGESCLEPFGTKLEAESVQEYPSEKEWLPDSCVLNVAGGRGTAAANSAAVSLGRLRKRVGGAIIGWKVPADGLASEDVEIMSEDDYPESEGYIDSEQDLDELIVDKCSEFGTNTEDQLISPPALQTRALTELPFHP